MKAVIFAPLATGPVLIAVTATLGVTAYAIVMACADIGIKALVMILFAIPVAVFWGVLIGWQVLLASYPLSLIVTNSLAWYLDRASRHRPYLRSAKVWKLSGAVAGLIVAVIANLVIELRPEGFLFFTRESDGAALWRSVASVGCVIAGASTLALWRRMSYGRTQPSNTPESC